MAMEERFHEYFAALDRAGDADMCFLCRRTPAEVKRFFGFYEDGTPIDPATYGLEDVVLSPKVDVMSYRGVRPVCAVCQLSWDSLWMAGDEAVLAELLHQMEHERERLWPDGNAPG
jgi:hypothetical protein